MTLPPLYAILLSVLALSRGIDANRLDIEELHCVVARPRLGAALLPNNTIPRQDADNGHLGAKRVPSDTGATLAQLEGRMISDLKVVGLKSVPREVFVNHIRSQPGTPLSATTIASDVSRITRLGAFRDVVATTRGLSDGSVAITFQFEEVPLIKEVQIVGNNGILRGDLIAPMALVEGKPMDSVTIARAIKAIQEIYIASGYAQCTVRCDEAQAAATGIVRFEIEEGNRALIASIKFDGVPTELLVYANKLSQWRNVIAGQPLAIESVHDLVADVIRLLTGNGYIETRVDHLISFDAVGTSAQVTVIADPGKPARIGTISFQWSRGGLSEEEIDVLQEAEISRLQGKLYSEELCGRSRGAMMRTLMEFGFANAKIKPIVLRTGSPLIAHDESSVEVRVYIEPGDRYWLGNLIITGNSKYTAAQILAVNRGPSMRDNNITNSESLLVPGEVLNWQKARHFVVLLESMPWCTRARMFRELPRSPYVDDAERGSVVDVVCDVTEGVYVIDKIRGATSRPLRLEWHVDMSAIDVSAFSYPRGVPPALTPGWRLLRGEDSPYALRKLTAESLAAQSPNEEALRILCDGDAELIAGRWYEALEHYEKVIRDHAGVEAFVPAIERELLIAGSIRKGGEDTVQSTGPDESPFDVAEELLIRVQERLPGSKLAERAAKRLVELYQSVGEHVAAIDAAGLFRQNYPQSDWYQEGLRLECQLWGAAFQGPGFDMTPLREALELSRWFEVKYPAAAASRTAELENSLAVAKTEACWNLMNSLLLSPDRCDKSRRFLLQELCGEVPELTAIESVRALLQPTSSLVSLPPSPVPELEAFLGKGRE